MSDILIYIEIKVSKQDVQYSNNMSPSNNNKTLREQQHPRPAKIRKCEHKLSVAISYSDPLHGKLHHATTFQAVMGFPQFHLPGAHLSWKI